MVVALPFRTAKEAVALGNNTVYGLGASVWTERVSLALEVAIGLKAGSVWINSHNLFDAAAGFGGYKQSGYGRDGGREVHLKHLAHESKDENFQGFAGDFQNLFVKYICQKYPAHGRTKICLIGIFCDCKISMFNKSKLITPGKSWCQMSI